MNQPVEQTFTLTGPPWVVADGATLRQDPATRKLDPDGVTLAGGSDGADRFVALFTDQDLAERFAEAIGAGDGIALSIREPATVLRLLKNAAGRGDAMVAMDPTFGKPPAVLIPISTVVEAYRSRAERRRGR